MIVILLFVVIGREDHGFVSDGWDYARVSAPFVIGLGLTIIAVRAWRTPTDWRTGIALAFGTLLLGMVVRRFVFDAGTARIFIAISGAFFLVGMVGWRLMFAGAVRLVAARRASAA